MNAGATKLVMMHCGGAIVAALLMIPGLSGAAEPDPLFASSETLQVTLAAPLRRLMKERDESEEFAGKLSYTDSEGGLVELDVLVRTRGKFRARHDICEFTPLRLNFRKSQVAATLFANQDKLKLVTHCENRSLRYKQAVISEYLTYRLLNVITDFSYRVRLLRIRYEFTDSNTEFPTYAFLIENDKRLAKRIEHGLVSKPKLRIADLDRDYNNLIAVFQFLVGNTDFSPIAGAKNEDCCHNMTPFSMDNETFYSVPYDFDQCGLVDSPYAAPNPRFRLRSVRQRLYRGRCVNNELLPQTLELYRSRRPAIEALLADQDELSRITRSRIEKYVTSFYRIIDDPKGVRSMLVKECI